ncbi:hypothetical protein TNCT_260061 [Trichonephila clavata]|uniref:Uncharacterized protein n=1 Tax=Trichonephila clavata TaxID=2740835 RepID=A0A8X6G5E7_TRICU|nr:hypothetical protein TNCT_260061 [Trichonephila clavata]
MNAPKPGIGTTNDGNTSKAFFWSPAIASSIPGIDKILCRKLSAVLASIAWHEIKAQFKEFCLAIAKLYGALYPWCYMP